MEDVTPKESHLQPFNILKVKGLELYLFQQFLLCWKLQFPVVTAVSSKVVSSKAGTAGNGKTGKDTARKAFAHLFHQYIINVKSSLCKTWTSIYEEMKSELIQIMTLPC
jgi:hypothetical protein